MVKYVVVHNKHEGCYDYKSFEDEVKKLRFTSIVINPPKLFMFDDKEQAHEFFTDYINDVDDIDPKCRKNDEIEHVEYCTCGIIDVDEDDNPILFYNKRNQIFLMEFGGEVFVTSQSVKQSINNVNVTNKLLRKHKLLDAEQKKRYIELGKLCEECSDK
uniref:Uncharacterized protein n=1 Tax=viral metagenome TaxID=1070528 RepID=A0A6C0EPC8_9ZZZZ